MEFLFQILEKFRYDFYLSLRSVAGLVIQATGRTEFEDGLRLGSPGGVLSDNPSVRTSTVKLVWPWVRCGKIPSVGGGDLVHLEVPASSSSGISFPVPLGGTNFNAVSSITC